MHLMLLEVDSYRRLITCQTMGDIDDVAPVNGRNVNSCRAFLTRK